MIPTKTHMDNPCLGFIFEESGGGGGFHGEQGIPPLLSTTPSIQKYFGIHAPIHYSISQLRRTPEHLVKMLLEKWLGINKDRCIMVRIFKVGKQGCSWMSNFCDRVWRQGFGDSPARRLLQHIGNPLRN